jgi:O-antigen/teichoic acid export membrane protein
MSWAAIGQVVGQSFWLGSLLVLARLLSPGAFGSVTIGLLLVTAATRLMGSATVGSMIVAERLSLTQVMTALKFNTASCIALSGGIALLSGPMANAFSRGGDALVIAALGVGVAFYGPSIVPLALLSRGLLFKRRAFVQAGATITASTTSVVAGLLGAGVWSLVIRQLLYQALLACLSWVAARHLLPPRAPKSQGPRWQRLAQKGAVGFLVFSLTDFVVFNADYLVVGRLTDTTQLGLYSLAFTIAFAPVSQISAQLGLVLFPAAAASDPDAIRRRTVLGARLTGLVLLPLLPIAFVLAPVVVPSVLGARWQGIVGPLQILLVVGVAHAIVNVIGESLSGTGNIDFRARVNVVWMVGMFVALILLVRADGINGAALAHLLLYVPVAVAYCVWGLRRLGARPRELGRALLSVSGPVGLQAVVTLGLFAILHGTSLPAGVRASISVIAGVAAFGCLIAVNKEGALADARSLLKSTRRGD